jgi:uncharacterized protein (TIGR02421 family)
MTTGKEYDLTFIKIEQTLAEKINSESSINVQLPNEGFLYMERPLPFIIIYRYGHKDKFIEGLVKNEASGFSIHESYHAETKIILQKLAREISRKFGAFLIIEIWPSYQNEEKPVFKILAPEKNLPSTFHFLLEQLSSSNDIEHPYQSTIENSSKRCPDHLEALFKTDELKKMESLLIGLEIPAFYQSKKTGRYYPLVARDLKRNLSQIFQKTFFEFIKVQTDHRLKNFQVLGKRSVEKIVWEVDEQLAAINNVYDFLLLVSPLNSKEAWEEFNANNFRKTPVFHYRMIPMDPEKLKRKLYNIPIEHVDDPTLGYLFRDKRWEIDKMLTMLGSRNTEEFLYGSLQVYGGVKNNLLNIAKGLLTVYPFVEGQDDDTSDEEGSIGMDEFIKMAYEEFEFLKEQYPAVEPRVRVKNDMMGLMVNKGGLLIGSDIKKFSPKRARALIQHEIGTHSLTYFNGKSQPLKLLYSGVPGYEELQEGLAVFAEYLSGGLTVQRIQILAARVIAADSLIKGNDFINTFFLLKDEFNIDSYTSFIITIRVYRGGGLTKDIVYLRGFIHLLEYLKEGNDIAPLLIGKIRQDYIPIINELVLRNILKPAPITPRYLIDPACLERLNKLDKDKTIFNII